MGTHRSTHRTTAYRRDLATRNGILGRHAARASPYRYGTAISKTGSLASVKNGGMASSVNRNGMSGSCPRPHSHPMTEWTIRDP
jgi:hypothetical protein